MRWNWRRIVGTIVVLWYGLILAQSVAKVAQNWGRPTAPPEVAAQEDDAFRFLFKDSPAMRQAVARNMRLVVFPTSRLEDGFWHPGAPTAYATFGADAPMSEVQRFYSTQYASNRPLYQYGKTPFGSSVLMFWQQPDAAYLVMIRPGDTVRRPFGPHSSTGPEARTVFRLARLPYQVKLAPNSPLPWQNKAPISPRKFGFPLPPGSRVDYCGWARGERGMMGMALAEVNSAGGTVGAFYRDITSNVFNTGGESGRISWYGNAGHFEATYQQMHESLPTVVVLEHAGGRWWQRILPPMFD